MTSDLLARTAGALGLKNPSTTKDGRIALIMSTLSEPATCRAAVERASAEARSLFARIRERGGSVTFQEVNGALPSGAASTPATTVRWSGSGGPSPGMKRSTR